MGELIAGLGLSEIFLVVIGLLTPPLIVFGVKNRSDQIIISQSEVPEALGKANQGDLESQMSLGWMYYKGRGGNRNYSESHKWYTKAAEQGNKNAINMVKKLTEITGL